MAHRSLSRRRLLGLAAAGGAGLAAAPALAGCQKPASPGVTVGSGQLPTYLPFAGTKPDLKTTRPEFLDGYFTYPTDRVDATTEKPLNGSTITSLCLTYGAIPPALDRNPYAQDLNAALGGTFQFNAVSPADYTQRFATTVAGGELPDVLEVLGQQPHIADLLKAKCQDLTPYVQGDAAKEFPLLANLPTDAWKTVVFNGRIYGVPITRPVIENSMFTRNDLITKRGLDPAPKSFDEFLQLSKDLTDEKSRKWALSLDPLRYVVYMLGGCNGWTQTDGKLVNLVETEQYTQALEATRKIVAAGCLHPDAFSPNGITLGKNSFNAGTCYLHLDGYSAWGDFATVIGATGGTVDVSSVPGFDQSTKPAYAIGAGTTGFVAIKKSDDARAKQVLSFLNWMAAPFGTNEQLFRKFGKQGRDFTFVDGNPQRTKLGTQTTGLMGFDYHIMDGPKVLYTPGLPKVVKRAFDWAAEIAPIGVKNPTVGIYSESAASKSAVIGTNLRAAEVDILTGRKPVSSFADALDRWRSGGGDAIRQEYQQAM